MSTWTLTETVVSMPTPNAVLLALSFVLMGFLIGIFVERVGRK